MNQDGAYSEKTRKSLLSRLKDWDDDKSWRDFFNTYWKLIYGAALKAGLSDAEAHDVVQETVVTVCKKIKDLKYDPALGSFRGWLLNTTRWKITDQFRKRQPHGVLPDQPKEAGRRTGVMERIPDPASFDLDSVWDVEWQKNLMDAAIERVKAKVDAKHYQVFDLHVLKEKPAQQVAKTLGMNVAQVYLVKHRLTGLLKKEIKRLEKNLV
jgi:RNA polymerase sigma-70 factor (ECF subfamily)